MKSDVTAVMTAMTDAERPWTQEALNSILRQTVLPDAIVLLVESANAWIDAELRGIGNSSLLEKLVTIHRIPMARLGAVRNAGVQRASTRWVAYLDGDDVWAAHRLETQLRASRRHPTAKFIAGDFVFINALGRPFGFSNGTNPTPSSWLVDRELMLAHPFDPHLSIGEDYFWLKSTKHLCERVRVPQVVVGYRIRGLSVSAMHYGHSRQRRVREAMARMSHYTPLRYAMLFASYLRYWLNRGERYAV